VMRRMSAPATTMRSGAGRRHDSSGRAWRRRGGRGLLGRGSGAEPTAFEGRGSKAEPAASAWDGVGDTFLFGKMAPGRTDVLSISLSYKEIWRFG
jgi:hypothetical protein